VFSAVLSLLIRTSISCRGLVQSSNDLFRFYSAFILVCCGLAGVDWLTLLRAARSVLASGVLLLSFRLLAALSFRYVFGVALFFSAKLFRYIYEILFEGILLHYFKIQMMPNYNFGSILSCVFKIFLKVFCPSSTISALRHL